MVVFTAATGAAVDHQDRYPVRVPAFLNVEFMGRINGYAMLGIGLDFRVEGEHETLRVKDLTGV
jgi:hypothetical protein